MKPAYFSYTGPLHESHRWGKTFMGDRFPYICMRCLARDDDPVAGRECDAVVERVNERQSGGRS